MPETTSLWDLGASEYRERAKQIFFYQRTAAALVDMAQGRSLYNAVDVGSGSSGILARALLTSHPELNCLYCVDASPQMVRELIEELHTQPAISSRVRYLVADAENLDQRIETKCEAVFANSAFWLFNLDSALASIGRSLNPSGSLYFNLSEWDLLLPDYAPHPKYAFIEQELKDSGIDITKSKGSRRKLNAALLRSSLLHHGFSIVQEIREDIRTTKNDWCNFYSIPSIAMRSIPELPHAQASKVLISAISKMPEDLMRPVRWIHYEARIIDQTK